MQNFNLHKEVFMGRDAWAWKVCETEYHAPIYGGGLWIDAPDGVGVNPDGSTYTVTAPKQILGTCQYAACETYSGMLRKIKRECAEVGITNA